MRLTHGNSSYEFTHVDLEFDVLLYENVFAKKNNKTLRETVAHKRYQKFSAKVEAKYSEHFDSSLGEFLLVLKDSRDPFYLEFLNKYGDQKYSTFFIANPADTDLRGIYAYRLDSELVYIGRCRDSLKK